MTSRRPAPALLAAAALLPPAVWLLPAWLHRQALSFRDQGDFFYPLKLYTADRLRAGDVPLWNPLSGGGEPWLANLQSGVFYPPTLLFLLPSAGLAAALYVALHFALAAWGAWKLARSEGASSAAALVTAGVLAAGGYSASLSGYWNHFAAWAYVPMIAALSRSGLGGRGQRIGLAVLIGLQAEAGSPEVSAGSILLALVLAAAFREEAPEGWAPTRPATSVRRALVASVFGLALAAWALVPFAELALRSDRARALPSVEREYGALGARGLASLAGLSDTGWSTAYLSSLLLGPAALFCAAAAWGDRSRRRVVLLLAAVGAAGLLVALEWPPGPWLRALPPLDRIRYPVKALGATVFAVAALAGLGADRLRFDPPRGIERLLLAALAVALGGSLFFSRLPANSRIAIAVSLVPFLLLLVLPGRSDGAARGILQAAGALALVASLVLAGRPLFQFVDESEVRREPETVRPLVRVAGRVLTPPPRDLSPWVLGDLTFSASTLRREREALVGYTNLLFGISTLRTAAALPIREAAETEATVDASPDPVRAAGAAGARVLWTPLRPAQLPSRKRGDFFEAPLSPYLPRVSFFADFRVEPDAGKAMRDAAEGRVDFTREVLLDRAPPSARQEGGSRKFLVARIAEDRPERVAIEASLGSPGVVVLADRDYPGWVAEVDGSRAPILLANGTFRAVSLPAGAHRVVFRYRPLSLYAGGALSVAAWITLLLLWMGGEPARREVLL